MAPTNREVNHKVVVTHWVPDDVVEYLREFSQPVAPREPRVFSRSEVLAHAHDASAILACMADRVDESFLGACPRLRIISAALKGFDNFDAAACRNHGVWLTIVPDLLTEPTADLAIALTLDITRRISEADRDLRLNGFPGWRPVFYGSGLSGATVGLLGMGALGRAVARRLVGFGCHTVYFDARPLARHQEKTLAVRRVDFEELLATCDIAIALLPLTSSTQHLLNAAAIARLRPGAFLVNVGRGSVVDEQAVAEALTTGRLAGYAADVFEMEDWARPDRPPAIPEALLRHPRTVLTPHLGSAVRAARRDIAFAAARQIRQVLRGNRPDHPVNEPTAAL
ncbi:NAD(P)-dependent oxidoreductase [Mycobacterium sp.]|uniref:NAD(P)-dependent oxidoreductase n=1 Tax=Mycobacterium sp. TaxID=1785 RepID=UPI0025FF292D|nr:NAD(P)-dependent oxidoreductase [Mycobacterium sp.]